MPATDIALRAEQPVVFDNGFATAFGFQTKDPDFKKPLHGIPVTLSDFSVLVGFEMNDYNKAKAKLLLNSAQAQLLDEIHATYLVPALNKMFEDNAWSLENLKVGVPHWNNELSVTFPTGRPVDMEFSTDAPNRPKGVYKADLSTVKKQMADNVPREMCVKMNVYLRHSEENDQYYAGYYATVQKISF